MSGPPVRRALLCAMPAVGHVDPVLVVARELLRRGWEVDVLTGARYEGRVTGAGAGFVALPPEADTLDAVGSSDERRRGLDALNAGVEEAFVRPAPAAARRIEEHLAAHPVDLVLHDSTFLGVQGLLARPRAQRPLVVLLGIGPVGFSSRDCPPFGLGIVPSRLPVWGSARDAVLRAVAPRLLAPVHRSLDAFLASVGAATLGSAFFTDVVTRSDLLAQGTVPEFEYPRSDAPRHLRFYGPMQAPPPPGLQAPDWLGELGGRPVVHVTQGTVANTDFSELVGPALEALADEPVDVVLTAGGRAVSDLPALPSNAHAADYLPYDALLPLTRAFVTNGGYGGLHQAMRHGVPIVIAGDSEDKVETSARVRWSGAGISLGTGRPTAAQVGGAVRRVLADDRYALASRRIGGRIAASRGAAGLVDDVEELLAPL